MNKIEAVFKAEGKAFIPFITAGDPSLEKTEELIYAIEKAGAKIIEIGIPFSDPIAEGTVIQAADARALAAGCKIDNIFDMLKRVRENTNVTLVFLTYINPIFVYGKEKFLKRCQEVDISGIIVPDVPFEERGLLLDTCREYGVDLIQLIAPTSEDRIQMLAREAKGYIYVVSSLGVTGVRSDIKTDIKHIVEKIRAVTATPIAVGFGIATPNQAKTMAEAADGAIVGSAIVKLIGEKGKDCVKPVAEYVEKMVAAVKEAK